MLDASAPPKMTIADIFTLPQANMEAEGGSRSRLPPCTTVAFWDSMLGRGRE